MAVPIVERFISANRPGARLVPQGLVVHSTANPGVDAEAHWRYWNSGDRGTSVHLVVDWRQAIALIPWEPGRAEVAWHAGREANQRFLSLEICEATHPDQAQAGWQNAVAVAAQVLQAYGWGEERLLGHAHVTWWIGGTDHVDPLPYFARWGWSWGHFAAAVAAALGRRLPDTAPVQRTPVPIVDAAGQVLAEGWLEGDRTAVLLRDLAGALGLRVEWDGQARRARLRWPGSGGAQGGG